MVSAAIFICQVANTIIFASFAYNFGKLYLLLDEYMRETDAMNITLPNSTVRFHYAGVNAERINEIDNVRIRNYPELFPDSLMSRRKN
jgi:hypothetical protein